MGIHESGENYLETILLLQRQNGFVRSVDVAGALNYTKASISRAMRILKEQGFVEIARSGQITLTEEGRRRAEGIYERHLCITQFLMQVLGLDLKTADADACRIEHVISEETRTSSRMTASGEPHGGKRGTAARARALRSPSLIFAKTGGG